MKSDFFFKVEFVVLYIRLNGSWGGEYVELIFLKYLKLREMDNLGIFFSFGMYGLFCF